MQIANSAGCPTRSPVLVVEEYDHWKVRMERFLHGKEKGESIWRSIKEVPCVPVRTIVRDAAAQLICPVRTSPNYCYKLRKAIYGLKQAPRTWYETLTDFLKRSGFKRGILDPTLF